MFKDGPLKPAANTNFKVHEIVSIILLEGVVSVASSAVLVNGCQALEGKYPFETMADGSINKPATNYVRVNTTDKAKTLVLNAKIETPDTFREQAVNVSQYKKSGLKGAVIAEYFASASVNRQSTLLSMYSNVKVLGQNNKMGLYQNQLLKHFYTEQGKTNKNQKILGWGMASLLKKNFPINTLWSRFKAFRNDGKLRRIVLQLDQLVGTSSCRIAIDGVRSKKKQAEKADRNSLALKGIMTISRSKPNDKL